MTAKYVTVTGVRWVFNGADLLTSMREHLPAPLRRACKNGACGVCRCRLLAGSVDYGQRQPFALWQDEIAQGYILPCIAVPATDVALSEISYEPVRRPKR